MARRWSGFLPQNQTIKEEWDLLEACEAQAKVAEQAGRDQEAPQASGPPRHEPKSPGTESLD